MVSFSTQSSNPTPPSLPAPPAWIISFLFHSSAKKPFSPGQQSPLTLTRDSLVFQHLRWGLRIALNNLPFFWNRSNYLNIKLLKISVSKLEQCSSGALPSLKSFPLQNCFSDPLILYLLLRGNDVYEPALWGCNSRKEMRAGRCNVRTQLKQLQLPRKYVYKKKIKWGQIKQQIHSEHPSIHPLNRIYCRFFCVHFLCFVTD